MFVDTMVIAEVKIFCCCCCCWLALYWSLMKFIKYIVVYYAIYIRIFRSTFSLFISFLFFSCLRFSSSSSSSYVHFWFHSCLHSFICMSMACIIFTGISYLFILSLVFASFFFFFSLLIDKRRCIRTIMYHHQQQQSMIRLIVYAITFRLNEEYTRSIMVLCETIQQAFMCK